MSQHTNFLTVQADTNYELGLQLGSHFRAQVQAKMDSIVRDGAWTHKLERAKEYLAVTDVYFPQYVEEIRGYAKGTGVDFLEFWAQSLEDEFSYYRDERCTSVITNGGQLIAHNEDWAKDAADQICILQKTIGDLTIFELNYFVTLGGNSASVNSHGYVQLINTLTHTDWQMGVPRNVIGRFLSETRDPASDFQKLKTIRRSTGYNHNIVSLDGNIWNIEATAQQQMLLQPPAPFVHTNHYLSEQLQPYEANAALTTRRRYAVAMERAQPHMTAPELMGVTSDRSQGPDLSVFNERTIARMIIDLEQRVAHCWLGREVDKGWIAYPLTFLA
ncbi:MAG TPA: C45 family peptidase [Ktedonobacterales bacterium]